VGHHARRYTSGKGIQQVLDRIGALILASKNGGLICMQLKLLFVGDLLPGTIEAGNRATIVVSTNPLVAHTKPAFSKVRFFSNRVYSTLQGIHIDTVYHIDCLLFSHFILPLIAIYYGPRNTLFTIPPGSVVLMSEAGIQKLSFSIIMYCFMELLVLYL
jgi:hypothetical protein